MKSLSQDYSRIEKAIRFLENNIHARPPLSEIARSANLSEYHFQRLFKRWAGISPKRFLQFLTVEHAKKILQQSKSLLDATYAAGLSSPGRLHDLFVAVEAVTPGEFKRKGAGLKITYGFHSSPFGECLLAITDRGICGLSFVLRGNRTRAFRDLKIKWEDAEFAENPKATQSVFQRIFPSTNHKGVQRLSLFLQGTNFHIKVWEALLRIPRGSLISYEDLAARVGKPGAARAVGNAVAQNPIAFIIPCHRVIRKVGAFGDYHWGAARKKAMLAWEVARHRNGDEVSTNSAPPVRNFGSQTGALQ